MNPVALQMVSDVNANWQVRIIVLVAFLIFMVVIAPRDNQIVMAMHFARMISLTILMFMLWFILDVTEAILKLFS